MNKIAHDLGLDVHKESIILRAGPPRRYRFSRIICLRE